MAHPHPNHETALMLLRTANSQWSKDLLQSFIEDQRVLRFSMREILAMAAAVDAREKAMREALEAIAKGEGPYARDPLTHAANAIEAMKDLARQALATLTGAAP